MTRRERLERRLAKRQEWAESRKRKAAQAWDAHYAVPLPPGGEPIKVGHHSEKRHRAAIEKSHNLAFKAIEHQDMAKEHESKAAGIADARDDSVFSDDHNAIEKLEARIAEREAERDKRKAINKAFKSGNWSAVVAAGLMTQEQADKLASRMQVCGMGTPYPSYSLQNIGANIRRDKQRIEHIKRLAAKQQEAEDAGGMTIKQRDNYAIVTFAEKPNRNILDALRSAGFWWGNGSWSGLAANLPACVRDLV